MQSLQIFKLRGRRIQRDDDSLDDFRRKLRLGNFEARQASHCPLHLSQYLLKHSRLSNLSRAPDPGNSLQQSAIETLADLAFHRLDLSHSALAVAIHCPTCGVAIASVPVCTNQGMTVSARFRPESGNPSVRI